MRAQIAARIEVVLPACNLSVTDVEEHRPVGGGAAAGAERAAFFIAHRDDVFAGREVFARLEQRDLFVGREFLKEVGGALGASVATGVRQALTWADPGTIG